ncbi:type II toxin-antitoxin system RelE/ParE family toxin [Mucilaginibacter sp. McL0603]|uniref:type II toxin-antitoxin system RelE/ParE family toxin n=1 Tax=Mucilaginibacter sp. McL0603 TaxID=3415670 RepID=UPI003CE7D5D3
MSYTIIWTSEALTTFEDRITYLKINWTEKEIKNFKKRVNEYFEVLKEEPLIGKNTGRFKNVHIGLIIKQVSIIYRVKTSTKEIELISFIDNRRNPRKIKKYKA